MEELRPKRSAVKKVLTYNINYHQIGYSEQRELQRALKNSLIEAKAAGREPSDSIVNLKQESNDLVRDLIEESNQDLKSDLLNDLRADTNEFLVKRTNDLSDNNRKVAPENETNGSRDELNKESIDQIIDEVISRNLPIDSNENSSLNTSLNASLNSSINATISTVIDKFVTSSPTKESQTVKNLFRKKVLKKNKLISPGRRYLFNSCSSTKLSKRTKKALCGRKSTLARQVTFSESKLKEGVKRVRKSSDENLKDELNYKKRLKLDSDLLSKLKDVEESIGRDIEDCRSTSKKQCKSDKSLSNQVTNVFNEKREEFLNHLICIRKLDDAKEDLISNSIYNQLDEFDLKKNFIDDQLLDEQLSDRLDLDNLINSLIDKLDESSSDLKSTDQHSNQQSNQLANDSSSLSNPFITSHFIEPSTPYDHRHTMVSNKNLSSLNSSGDKLNQYKTNGHTNGQLDTNESQMHSLVTASKTKSKANKLSSCKRKKDTVNKTPSKSKTKSLYDLHVNEQTIKKEPDTDSMGSSSIDESINAAINSVINNLSDDTLMDDSFDTFTSFSSPLNVKKIRKKRGPKLSSLENCIKKELKKKLLQKSFKLSSNKKNDTKELTNGSLTNGKKKNTTMSSKFNEKADKVTKVKKKDKNDKSNSPNGKQQCDKKVSKKKNEDGKTIKKPRTPHLAKSKLNKQSTKQTNGRRKNVKKELLKKSELLIRNLYKFRQYLKIKKQELLNLDRDELSLIDLLGKDYLMNCFIDSNNFEIDFDIYDPLTISGLMSTQPFAGNNSILSSELLYEILNNIEEESKINGHTNDRVEEYSTEDDELSISSSFKDSSSEDSGSDDESESDDSDSSDTDSSDSDSDDSDLSSEKSKFSESWTSATSTPK